MRLANPVKVVLILFAALSFAWLTGCKKLAPNSSGPPPVRVSSADGDAAEPVMATGRDNSFYVAWVEHLGDKGADVFCAPSDHNGLARRAPTRVNPEAGAAKAWNGDPPSVAVGPDNAVYIAWTARASGPANNLYLSVSRDGGQTFAAPIRVNDDDKPSQHGMHSLAVGPDGRVFLAWLDERNVAPPPEKTPETHGGEHKMAGPKPEPNSEVFWTVSQDGGRTLAPNKKLASDACPCCKTSLAVAANGRVYASWRQVLPGDFRHIAVATSGDGGQTFAAPVIVSDDKWQLSACPVSGAALEIAADGALNVLWYAEGAAGEPGLYRAVSRDGAQTFSPRQLFAAGRMRGSPLLLNNGPTGASSAIWQANAGEKAQPMTTLLDAQGNIAKSHAIAAAGELPSAVSIKSGLFVAYIVKTGEKRAVWVVKSALSD